MKILFIHQNFPGQFRYIVAKLLEERNNEVVALTMRDGAYDPRLKLIRYQPQRSTTPTMHPWVQDLETKVIRGEAVLKACERLQAEGFTPEVIMAHPGWGESLFVKNLWPEAKLILYSEFHYAATGLDSDFDPEFARPGLLAACRTQLKNANSLLHFPLADAALSPTEWQKSSYPEPYRSKITVIHDGIDTDLVRPKATAKLELGNLSFDRDQEIITFVNRNLEPYRGYHIFMRALPELLAKRPKAQVLIVGGSSVSYGAKPEDGSSWKDIFLNEVKNQIDLSRVHFLGNIPYPQFLTLLQISTVHVYLTYPFVLSWSLLEAMAAECAIVASATPPVLEVIKDGETGLLVDFFSPQKLTDKVITLLDNPELRHKLGSQARQLILQKYDLKRHCLPRMIEFIQQVHGSAKPAA